MCMYVGVCVCKCSVACVSANVRKGERGQVFVFVCSVDKLECAMAGGNEIL